MICPVPPEEDCPIKWLTVGLFILIVIGTAINVCRYPGCRRLHAPPVKQQDTPAEKPYAQFPKLSKHCETCKQCANPISETGEEQGLCEEGFRLLQEDVQNAQ